MSTNYISFKRSKKEYIYPYLLYLVSSSYHNKATLSSRQPLGLFPLAFYPLPYTRAWIYTYHSSKSQEVVTEVKHMAVEMGIPIFWSMEEKTLQKTPNHNCMRMNSL